MRARERFEHTEPWGFSPEASGVRTRPDLEREIALGRETVRLEEIDVPDTACMAPLDAPPAPPSTTLLAPLSAAPSSVAARAAMATRRLTRPIRAVSPPPPSSDRSAAAATAAPASTHLSAEPLTNPPALAPTLAPTPVPPSMQGYAPTNDPPLQAAVHASVYASVHAVLLAASRLSVPPPAPTATLPPPAPASAIGWSTAQRIYVLATAVALSVMATAILFLAIGSSDAPDARGAQASRTARASGEAAATLDLSSGGSAARKAAAPVAVTDPTETRPATRRAFAGAPVPAPAPGSPVRSAQNSGVSTTATTAPPPGGTAGSAKLGEAARSAKMLREQLNSAVN